MLEMHNQPKYVLLPFKVDKTTKLLHGDKAHTRPSGNMILGDLPQGWAS